MCICFPDLCWVCRERAAGYYATYPFALAQLLIEIPYVLVQSVFFSCITYFMIYFYIDAGRVRITMMQVISSCLSVSLFVCLPACVSACLPACLSPCLSVCLPVCLSICLSVYRQTDAPAIAACYFMCSQTVLVFLLCLLLCLLLDPTILHHSSAA